MKNLNGLRSDFLFSTPTFLSGAGTVINIAGNFYEFNGSPTGIIADEIAIGCDFGMIGQDIKDVVQGG